MLLCQICCAMQSGSCVTARHLRAKLGVTTKCMCMWDDWRSSISGLFSPAHCFRCCCCCFLCCLLTGPGRKICPTGQAVTHVQVMIQTLSTQVLMMPRSHTTGTDHFLTSSTLLGVACAFFCLHLVLSVAHRSVGIVSWTFVGVLLSTRPAFCDLHFICRLCSSVRHRQEPEQLLGPAVGAWFRAFKWCSRTNGDSSVHPPHFHRVEATHFGLQISVFSWSWLEAFLWMYASLWLCKPPYDSVSLLMTLSLQGYWQLSSFAVSFVTFVCVYDSTMSCLCIHLHYMTSHWQHIMAVSFTKELIQK